MQGVQAFEPKAKTSIDLESFVAEDHFLRRIDRVLDLSFIRELTAAVLCRREGTTFDRSGSFLSHAVGGVLLRNHDGPPPVRGSPLQSRLSLVLPAVAR